VWPTQFPQPGVRLRVGGRSGHPGLRPRPHWHPRFVPGGDGTLVPDLLKSGALPPGLLQVATTGTKTQSTQNKTAPGPVTTIPRKRTQTERKLEAQRPRILFWIRLSFENRSRPWGSSFLSGRPVVAGIRPSCSFNAISPSPGAVPDLQMDSLWIRRFSPLFGRGCTHMRPKLHLPVFGHAFRVTGVLA
jgi:hypothetical protein